VEGWRLYLTDLDVEQQSYFAYWSKGAVHRVLDKHGQVNLFKVRAFLKDIHFRTSLRPFVVSDSSSASGRARQAAVACRS